MKNILPLFKSRQARPGFDELMRPHLDHLYRLAYRFCGNREDAEDLVQDLLIKLYPRQQEVAAIDRLRPWLVTTLYRMFIDDTRRRARSRLELIDDEAAFYDTTPGGDDQPDQILSRDQRITRMQAAFARLSDDHRSLITLHDIEGYKLTELSEMLEVPVGTLKSRIHRARARLRELIGDSAEALDGAA